jgi:hypothetical protein
LICWRLDQKSVCDTERQRASRNDAKVSSFFKSIASAIKRHDLQISDNLLVGREKWRVQSKLPKKMRDGITHSRTEIVAHLFEACFGYGTATASQVRAQKMADRLAVINRAEENADPFLAPMVDHWRHEIEQARIGGDASFFEDVARGLEYLKKEKSEPKLDANSAEGQVRRLTAWTAFRMIQSMPDLPFRDELISAVEYQIATHKFRRSPLAPPLPHGASNPASAVQDELRWLRMRRHAKEGLNWPRILKRLWLFDFLPIRVGAPDSH